MYKDANSGEVITTIIAITLVLLLLGLIIITSLFFYKKNHNRLLLERQHLESQFQQTLLQSQLEIQEQTLKNISQEIHDNIGQALSLAKLNLETLSPGNPVQQGIKIEDSKQLVGKAIQDLRHLSHSLNTDMIQQKGLLESVQYDAGMLQKAGNLPVLVSVTGKPFRFDPQKELITFRIIQETLNNIIKHAAATEVNIGFVYSEKALAITVKDNGKGFDVNTIAAGKKSMGLSNLAHRAQMIGAIYNLQSASGEGTQLHLTINI
jgi:two-component system, NarL family, sensor kinase